MLPFILGGVGTYSIHSYLLLQPTYFYLRACHLFYAPGYWLAVAVIGPSILWSASRLAVAGG